MVMLLPDCEISTVRLRMAASVEAYLVPVISTVTGKVLTSGGSGATSEDVNLSALQQVAIANQTAFMITVPLANQSLATASVTTQPATCDPEEMDAVDTAVADRLLDALNPAEVALALAAADEVTDRHQRISRAAELAVERARYEADRAERAFCQLEPENRLVARTLETRWETKLATLLFLEPECTLLLLLKPLTELTKLALPAEWAILLVLEA